MAGVPALTSVSAESHSRRWSRLTAPLVVLLGVCLVDLLTPRRSVVLDLVVVVPLLAAFLVGQVLTLAYGLLSTISAVLLGFHDHVYSSADDRQVQLIRIAAVLVVGAAAVLFAGRRVNRERHLLQMTRVAEVAQLAILAPIPPRIAGLGLAELYASAAVDARIGGDLYAAVDTTFGVRLLIGDVRGKGLEAVRLASHLLGAFRERAAERPDLLVLLDDLDRAVRRVADEEDFVTAAVAQITPDGRLSMVNAGHPAPLLLRHGVAIVLRPAVRRPPLGLPGECAVLTVQLQPGDRMLLYTDGLGEARRRGGGDYFPVREFATPALSSGTLEEGLRGVQRAVRDWTGGALSDDVALLAVEVLSVTETAN